LTFEQLKKMTARQIDQYYSVYEWQACEENIRNEFLYPKKGEPRELPGPARMADLVRERIKKDHKKS